MDIDDLYRLLVQLVEQPKESEWLEFKVNNANPDEIGKRISALANSACLHNHTFGYLVFGVEDDSHSIVGTAFSPKRTKKGNEELENWLTRMLDPKIDFRIHEFTFDGKNIVIFEIPAALNRPVKFTNVAYIRIGSLTKNLNEYPEKEKKIWQKETNSQFELGIAMKHVTGETVVDLLDTQSYFDLMKLPYPSTREAVLDRLVREKFIVRSHSYYNITNLGGILFAKNLSDFDRLARKAIRVIIYEGKNKLRTKKEKGGVKGYASGFAGLLDYINDQLQSHEPIGRAFRERVTVYPELAIRELVANALIHQDFHETGTGPMVELYSDRIEITNPGKPIITTLRFIDEYQSRNETLAAFMRKVGICEEKGSGIDKVISEIELAQLPAPDFQEQETHTKVTVYAHQELNQMDKADKIRACYQHCCLKYVSNEKMTNQSLRERFNIEPHNYSIASRIIDDTKQAGFVKDFDPDNRSKKHAKYIPIWA